MLVLLSKTFGGKYSIDFMSLTNSQVMTSVQSKIEERVHSMGVSDPVVQIWGSDRILVELPSVQTTSQEFQAIGAVGLLEFKEEKLDSSGNPVWIPATAAGTDGTQKELNGRVPVTQRVRGN